MAITPQFKVKAFCCGDVI